MLLKTLKVVSWLIAFGLAIVTIVPAGERPVTGLSHDFEHFLAFGIAGMTLAIVYAHNFRALIFGAIVYALVLELSQIPLATRHARLEDFVVDALAACVGIVTIYVWRNFVDRRAAFLG